MNLNAGLNLVLQQALKKKQQREAQERQRQMLQMAENAKAQGADVSLSYDPKTGQMSPKITYKGKSMQAIVDAQGNIVGWRPVGSVFQPKTLSQTGAGSELLLSDYTATKPSYNPTAVKSWEDVPISRRILAAISPVATAEEKNLGKVMLNKIFNEPKVPTAREQYKGKSKSAPESIRKRAIQALKEVNAPITENNIREAIRQLRG